MYTCTGAVLAAAMRAAAFALVALACGAAKVGSRPAAVGVRWAPGVATALEAAAMAAGQQDLPQQPEDASGHAAKGATPDSACSVSQSGNVPADFTAQAPQCQANGTRSCRTISPPSRGAAFDFASSPWKSPPGRSPDAAAVAASALTTTLATTLAASTLTTAALTTSTLTTATVTTSSLATTLTATAFVPARTATLAAAALTAALAAAAISTPFPAFDDSDVLTESDFNLFDADHTSQDAL